MEVEREELRGLFQLLNPDAISPSADTIKNHIMKAFTKEHTHLKEILQVKFIFNIKLLIEF